MNKKTKRAITSLAIVLILVIAVVVWLAVAQSQGVKPLCLFKHSYNEKGVCTRCGNEKPVEEPTPEPAEPQTTVSASAKYLASVNDGITPLVNTDKATLTPVGTSNRLDFFNGSTSDFQLSNLTDDDLKYYQTYLPYTERLIINRQYVSKAGVVEIPKSETLKIATADYTVYLSQETTNHLHFKKQNSETWTRILNRNYEEDVGDDVPFLVPFINEYQLTEFGIYSLCLIDINGQAKSEVITILYGVTISELPTAPVKTGYTFTGWYTDEACTELYTEDYVTSDITLYAGFKAHEYTIQFNANGGAGTMSNLAMTYDQSKALTANSFTKEHYAFKGWATSDNGAVVYSNNQSVKNLTSTDGATVNLYAVWERSEAVVTFNVDGKTSEVYVNLNSPVTLPDTPSKEGHIFTGWFYDDGTIYDGEDITEDTTLTAQFSVIRCTVTFIVDGEVYCVYVCDYGTSIAEALNGAGVNGMLYELDSEGENSRVFN